MAYCVDEAIDVFGSWVEGQLDGLKRQKRESDTAYSVRRDSLLMSLLGMQAQRKFANPMATKGGEK